MLSKKKEKQQNATVAQINSISAVTFEQSINIRLNFVFVSNFRSFVCCCLPKINKQIFRSSLTFEMYNFNRGQSIFSFSVCSKQIM